MLELAVVAPSPTADVQPALPVTLDLNEPLPTGEMIQDAPVVVRRRGIQPGMVAGDRMARTLDLALKDLARQTFEALVAENPARGRYFCWASGLTGADVLAWYANAMNTVDGIDAMAGCAPDGGLVFEKLQGRNGTTILSPVLLIEGKKQNDQGNAHERWYKNATLLRDLNPDVALLTFIVGEGARENGVMSKTFQQTLLHQGARKAKRSPDSWNTFYGQGASFYRQVEGFASEEIGLVLRLAMTTTMDHIVDQRQREEGVTVSPASSTGTTNVTTGPSALTH